MAKAILATNRADGSWYVTQVYPDGTDLTKVANPASGSLLMRVQGDWWSVGDNLAPEVVANGVATVLASISTIPWTQVKAAIN